MRQQQISFGLLFKHLKKGGVYIVEDLHTSVREGYGDENDIITTLSMLDNFKEDGRLISNHISDEDKKHIGESIDSINIWTRTPDFNESVTSIIVKK